MRCAELALPHLRRRLPQGFGEITQHIIFLVGGQSAGKSYYLILLCKVPPAALTQNLDSTMLEADPAGNATLNSMRQMLFSAKSAGQALLVKTQLEGAMYEWLHRYRKVVPLPKPFVCELALPDGRVVKGLSAGQWLWGRRSLRSCC